MLYLKGLNGIRTLAAFGVLITHIKYWMDLENPGPGGLPILIGAYGVTMFFALSGFLITYLLLKEKDKQQGKIAIKKFYIRRILRIWPLYFLYLLIVGIVLFFFWRDEFDETLIWYGVLLANVPMALAIDPSFLGPYWSLATEEQFYLFWPWLVRRKNEFMTLLIFLFAYGTIKVAFHIFLNNQLLDYFFDLLRFDCMAIGGLGAVLLVRQPNKLVFMFHPLVQVLSWGVIVLVIFGRFHFFSVIDHDIFAGVATILIINQCANPRVILSLENELFNFLGKISFGIYVYHPLVIYGWVSLFSLAGIHAADNLNWFFYIGVTVSTILVADLSYEFFEKIFLRKRQKFAIVQSTNSGSNIKTESNENENNHRNRIGGADRE